MTNTPNNCRLLFKGRLIGAGVVEKDDSFPLRLILKFLAVDHFALPEAMASTSPDDVSIDIHGTIVSCFIVGGQTEPDGTESINIALSGGGGSAR